MFSSLKVRAHCAYCFRTSASHPCGVDSWRLDPWAANRSFTAGLAIALFTAALSFATIGTGTPAGATRAYQIENSYLAHPASAIVGSVGSPGKRWLLVTASGRTLPAAA